MESILVVYVNLEAASSVRRPSCRLSGGSGSLIGHILV